MAFVPILHNAWNRHDHDKTRPPQPSGRSANFVLNDEQRLGLIF